MHIPQVRLLLNEIIVNSHLRIIHANFDPIFAGISQKKVTTENIFFLVSLKF